MSMSSSLTRRAIELCKAGNKPDARRMLQAVLQDDPRNQTAWNWYIETLSTPQERILALEENLEVNPNNWQVRRALGMLRHQQAARLADTEPIFLTPSLKEPEEQIPSPTFPSAPPVKEKIAPASKASQKTPYMTLVAVFSILLLVVLLIFMSQQQERINLLQRLYQDLQERHTSLQIDYEVTRLEKDQLASQLNELWTEYQTLNNAHKDLSKAYSDLENRLSGLSLDYVNLDGRYKSLITDYGNLQGDFNDLNAEYETLTGEVEALKTKYTNLYGWYTWLQNNAITPPYIAIHSRQVTLGFYAPDGSVHTWTKDINELERAIIAGQKNRENPNYIYLDVNGNKVREENYAPYVDPEPFKEYIPVLYYASGDDYSFIQNVRRIISQLAIYNTEYYEIPRHPLETFLMGGGDCEDLSILLASMLLAAPVDWDVRLVFMDIDHPQSAQNINHVIVYVDTGKERLLLEATNPDAFWAFDIQGWSVDVSK